MVLGERNIENGNFEEHQNDEKTNEKEKEREKTRTKTSKIEFHLRERRENRETQRNLIWRTIY